MLHDIFIKNAQNTAVIHKGEKISYYRLEKIIEKNKEIFLEIGINRYSNVGIYVKDSFNTLISYLALWRIGATPVMIDFQASEEDFHSYLENSECSHVISSSILNKKINNDLYFQFFKERKENKLYPYHELYKEGFVILFTSGSSGKPKPVVLKKEAIVRNAIKVRNYTQITHEDSCLITLPLTYSYAMSQTLSHLISGGTVIFSDQNYLVDSILENINKYQSTNYAATPYFYETLTVLLQENPSLRFHLKSIRFFMNAGGYLNPTIIRSMCSMVDHVRFFNNYGQTEASPRLTYKEFASSSTTFDGVGEPLPGVEIKIKDADQSGIGEISYKSEDIMLGYYNEIDDSSIHKWVSTGDLGRVEGNTIYVLGRKDSIIKVNGRKVHLNSIEDKLYEIPLIKHVKVIKNKHDIYGEYLEALIIPKNMDEDTKKIKNLIKGQMKKLLSLSERPKKIIIEKFIKVSPNGKILKKTSGE